MEQYDQIFIRIETNKDTVEFLLAKQPLDMIRGGFVTKDEIRQTVETGNAYIPNEYTLGIELTEFDLFITIAVKIDNVLKIVHTVEKYII
jgi:hypothetical protein